MTTVFIVDYRADPVFRHFLSTVPTDNLGHFKFPGPVASTLRHSASKRDEVILQRSPQPMRDR